MTVSIRASLLLSALAMAGLTAAFSAPPAGEHTTPPPAAAPSDAITTKPVAHTSHWSYSGEGGSDHWGELAPENRPCATGGQQSPIDLTSPRPASIVPPVTRWSPVNGAQVVNNGHTRQVNVAGPGSLKLDGKEYGLKQFDFHHPSARSMASLSRSKSTSSTQPPMGASPLSA